MWQLPGLRKVRPSLPEADWILIRSLYVLAVVMFGVVFYGVWRWMIRGPMPTGMVNVFWRFDRLYTLVWHRLRWVGRHNVPSTGPVILASNHTTGLDPFLIQAAVPRLVRWVMLRAYQYRIFNFIWKRIDTIAIEQDGGDVVQASREILRGPGGPGASWGCSPKAGLQRERRGVAAVQPGIAMLAGAGAGRRSCRCGSRGTTRLHSMFWHFAACRAGATVTFGKPYKPDPGMEISGDRRRPAAAGWWKLSRRDPNAAACGLGPCG